MDPEEDGAGERDGGEEGVGASVVAQGDAVPVLQMPEQGLGTVPLAVEGPVAGDRDLAAPG